METPHLIPAEDSFFRKGITVGHHFFIFLSDLIINEIGNKEINAVTGQSNIPDSFQNGQKDIGIQPVVRIDDFKVEPSGILQTGIYGLSVPSVFLMDCFTDTGVVSLVLFGNFQGIVFL